jgi:ribonuclease HII
MKKEERLQKEKEHLEKLKNFDLYISKDKYILGIDEVGRGPIAGPLVVCGIIMKKDSKILRSKRF